jgi:hypothetical protein
MLVFVIEHGVMAMLVVGKYKKGQHGFELLLYVAIMEWYIFFMVSKKLATMLGNEKRNKYPRFINHRNIVPDWMGYPGSDYSRYDPFQEDRFGSGGKREHELEGAGRRGWDYDQNRVHSSVYGNVPRKLAGGEKLHPHFSRDFRGKGPRNYRRSDEMILEDLHDKLLTSCNADYSDVEIKVRGGEVLLSGKVRERSVRRRIEDIAETVSGVNHIENCIRISRDQ